MGQIAVLERAFGEWNARRNVRLPRLAQGRPGANGENKLDPVSTAEAGLRRGHIRTDLIGHIPDRLPAAVPLRTRPNQLRKTNWIATSIRADILHLGVPHVAVC
ncbi:MAG TPA: hypothetical protein EYM83_05495 [Nitrospirales bacterium]|nr:hypothetical protein [Nitrospirales bacterium]